MRDSAGENALQLRFTLGRIEVAMSLAHDAITWVDQEGRIIWCNAAFDRLIRKHHIEILGSKLVDQLVLRTDGQPVLPHMHPANLISSEQPELSGVYETTSDGEQVIVDLHAHRRAIQREQEAVFVIRDATERVRIEEQLRALNTQLQAANVELEAFSYSVSHDLRTPLRALDGFSQALLEDYSDRLDAEGKDYLQRIRTAAQKMGTLIEDLLQLSRVTRTELSRDRVDVSSMARSIASELRARAPERDVELTIQDGLIAHGDERLLYQVLENLLDNAWKFTARVPRARIALGWTRTDTEVVFFVRDNGTGFDMSVADRLFGAFQRLHTVEEFPGTGIGLAIVRRIVHRHGGRTWAEGAFGKGATFYVALPEGEPSPEKGTYDGNREGEGPAAGGGQS